MYILNPVPHKTIWGGNRLSGFIPGDISGIGHLYMVNGHDEMSNEILNGKWKGKTLKEIFPDKKYEWNMEEYSEFPLTVALVDAKENLSIQVHPDDITAECLEHQKLGKTESWIFLDAPQRGWIYAGCQCNAKQEIEEAISRKQMETITSHFKIEKDQYVCIEAGTLHAMTEGSFVYEVEYGSDFTYRFYDYDRTDERGKKRELHIKKATASINPNVAPYTRNVKDKVWIQEEDYEICRETGLDRYCNDSEVAECLSVIEGEGQCEGCKITGGMSIILSPGEVLENIRLKTAFVARIRKTDV